MKDYILSTSEFRLYKHKDNTYYMCCIIVLKGKPAYFSTIITKAEALSLSEANNLNIHEN